MNYNPIKLQNDLRLIPTETLIQYVKGMNPEVPSYMALGVLKERKAMEAKYEAENQKAPESSVAEDLTQAPQGGLQMLAGNPMGNQAQPNQAPQGAPTMPADQGVASLDTGDMFDEQNFAGGGIVAFDDGGDVNYAGGGMVAFTPGGDVASKRYQALLEDSYLSPGSLYAGAKDLLGMPFQYRVAYDPTTDKYMSRRALEGNTPNLDMYRKAAELRKQGLLAEADTLEKVAASPQVNRPGLAGLDTSTADPGMTFSREEIANIYQSTVPPTKARPVAPPTAADTDVTKPAPGPAPQPKEAGIESLLENTDGLAEKRMARYKQMVGEDPERARLEELTRKYETGAAEQERTAPWMALAKAGFSMAGGKSPFAIQNISEGAQAGLADYVQAKDKLDKLTEKQIDIRTKMQQARRAEDIAGATYGLNSEAAVEARNAQVKLKDMEEKNANKRNEVSNSTQLKAAQIAAAKKSDYESFIELAKQDDDNYKTVKDKDGTVRKVFDANKVTQAFKSFGGSSGLDDDKLFAAYQQEKVMDKNYKKSFQEYKNEIRGTSGGAAPTANRPPLGNIFNTK
jgi:hypothetical protein